MVKKSKYSRLSREQLEAKLEKLERTRHYGLVWEDKEEDVAKQCEVELPVLEEDTSRELLRDFSKKCNFIIEGDNYHSLYTLNFTHKKKIDVIYIDPPYNTGKKDFVYNDNFVDKTDRYRHSKWLSFMSKRLRIAKNLLKDTGIIAISIDDNEMCNLKLLCDSIFNENNHIGTVPTIMNLKGNQDQFGFAGTHEYTLFYCKNKNLAKISEFNIDSENDIDWTQDEIGMYKKGRPLLADGKDKLRENRPKMYFPLLVKNNKVFLITEDEYSKIYNKDSKTFDDAFIEKLKLKYMSLGFDFVLPIDSKNKLLRWTWGYYEKFQSHLDDIIISKTKKRITFYKKQRPKIEDIPSKKPKSVFYRPEYSSGNGTNQLKQLDLAGKIDNPKPIELIKDILFICGNQESLILDFFAGSGTTGHAVLELNKTDGGNRQFILCTNNENNICEEVTYPRIKKVIDGYGGRNGITANLKYFKQKFVPAVISDQDKRELVNRSTELLCMAENTFEYVVKRTKNNDFAIFKNSTQLTVIIYDEESIDKCVSLLNEMQINLITIIYTFSYNHTYDIEDFENLRVDFIVKPIPEAILNTYRKISKMRKQ